MAIRDMQNLFHAHGLYRGPIDGKITPAVAAAARQVITPQAGWTVDRIVAAAAQELLNRTPYPAGLVDGVWGRNSRAAYAAWNTARTGAPAPQGGLRRIVAHWAASGYEPSEESIQAYHFLFDGDGDMHRGKFAPEANIRPQGTAYAMHTRNLNSGSIGVSLCAMGGAIERPFNAGQWPIKAVQLDSMARWCASLCKQYGITVSRETVLTHSEVQPTLKVAQRNKWDINWIPGMTAPGNPIAVGDRIREMVTGYL